MAKEQNNQHRYGVDAGDGSVTGALEDLSRSYVEFRREHQPRMRIPAALRKATLEAISNGIPEKQVLERCRISPKQLNRWRELQWGRRRMKRCENAKARVFKVMDGPLDRRKNDSQKEAKGETLELRIGQWEISIRQKVE